MRELKKFLLAACAGTFLFWPFWMAIYFWSIQWLLGGILYVITILAALKASEKKW